jgi:ABC-type branched-subunit amino acid transport system ATPase component
MPLLQVEKLVKSFGGLMALHYVNLEIFDAEILGVIGPNGLGKSTLFNVITGFLKANSWRTK